MQRKSHLRVDPHSELLDRLPNAVICTDLDGRVTYCNAAAEEIYEYSASELSGSSIDRLYPESEVSRMQAMLQDVVAKGKADRRFLMVNKRGRQFAVRSLLSRLTDMKGTAVGVIGSYIATTEAERADADHDQTAATNRAAREATGVGTWNWNLRDSTLWWDPVSCLLLDTPEGEEQSYDVFLMRLHKADRPRVEQALENCIRMGEPYVCEYRVTHRDGTVHWINSRGRLYADEDGKALRILGTATDISAQKQAQEQLGAAEAKYKALYDSPVIGVGLGDMDTFTDVNDAFCRIVGYSREELLAIRWQDITPPEHLATDFAALQQMVSTGACAPFEKEYVRKDGKRVRIILGAALVSRIPLSWSCFILDITEHHRALMALRSAEQVAAAAKMGSLLAHEINNPLAAITNALYLLRNGPQTLSQEELFLAAEESLERVTRITRQMIGIYASPERVSEIKVAEVLDDTVSGYAAQIQSKQLRFEKRNEFGKAKFRGVESDLRKLVSSMLENAVEHAPARGKVKVHISRGRDWTNPGQDGIRIVVADNGPGILAQNLPRLFEPFFSTQARPGKGLGMWTGASIVEKAKGKIKVRSTTSPARSFTCISVFLPEQTINNSVTV